ncbi:Asp-tRNA(Asn)/Glu-tRNA(Gln) amidotransferase subunit GatA [Candidatus Nasuia deltocephalinicola]|uniref:Asp-tRNA(Asn)/Glu-tRNA(Gln) amidotransferase subunit GatA n=1 Tax=Candidatus Nasuia deltocephalincola TaxID=1160784 RepID=A0A974WKL5_9PROT|nr:Asp-tRNA(Asn)/Glu-tRNA(Gln) amidotransferase subunit GatA [Candidatus Nasuia deltocephalinicola]
MLLKYFYLIYNKKINCFELSKYILKKIENIYNKNIFINLNYDFIFNQCFYSENLIKFKKNNILTGIPVIYKDAFNSKILKTTYGSRILKNYYSPYNSTVVNRLKNLGLINFGKTNMDEFCTGSNCFNYYYGISKNPINLYFTSGGSSGGSSYLVFKNLIPVSIGTDTGGSIKEPSLFNNLIGFKPTYGRISRYGIFSYSSSLDNVGFICKNIIDLSIFLNSLFNFDIKDSTTFNFSKEDFTRYLNKNWILYKKNIKVFFGLFIGISKDFFSSIIDYEIKSNLENIITIFEYLGAKIIFVCLYFYKFFCSIYQFISSSELYSNISKYDNFLYNNFNFINYFKKKKFLFFSNEIKNKFFLGNYILSSNNNKKFFLYSKKLRKILFEFLKKIFNICDIIIIPIVSKIILNPLKNINNFYNYIDFYSSISNVLGLPCATIPTGFYFKNKFKIPLGIQIISNHFKEAKLIQIINELSNYINF